MKNDLAIVALLILMISTFSGCIETQAAAADVTVIMEEDYLRVNMTPLMVNKISQPRDYVPAAPGLFVYVLAKNKTAVNYEWLSRWSSVEFTGAGTYNMRIGLWRMPRDNEDVKIIVQVVDASNTYYLDAQGEWNKDTGIVKFKQVRIG